MDGTRLAALRLHGLGAADRGWILARLDQVTQRRLGVLLRDLDEAGVDPAGAMMMDFDFPEIESTDTPQSSAKPSETVVRLNREDPGTIVRALSDEPGWLIAAVLSAHRWAWHEVVRERFGARLSAEGALPGMDKLKPLFMAKLLSALARRVDKERTLAPSEFDRALIHSGAAAGKTRLTILSRLKKWIT